MAHKSIFDICRVCNDKGKEGGCPRCGKVIGNCALELNLMDTIPTDIIPLHYQGKFWVKPESHTEREKQFDTTLNKVHEKFMRGEFPTYSMFIGAPPNIDKFIFAYSCLQLAQSNGRSIAPILMTGDWRRLYRTSQQNPTYKLFNKWDWNSLITKEILFTSVDSSEDRFDIIGLLKLLYDTRALQGLPTFVISDFELTTLVPKYRSEDYLKIYNSDNKRDYYRYPVVVQRFHTVS